jgi:hypothetical protein
VIYFCPEKQKPEVIRAFALLRFFVTAAFCLIHSGYSLVPSAYSLTHRLPLLRKTLAAKNWPSGHGNKGNRVLFAALAADNFGLNPLGLPIGFAFLTAIGTALGCVFETPFLVKFLL